MKKITTLVTLLIVTFCFGQIPNGYYNTATGTGYTLKTQLYNIIKGHNDRNYAGLYVTYTTSDVDNYYENNGSMLDMYTENPTGSECEYIYGGGLQDDGTLGTAECQRYNREHLIPQSVYSSNTPMYSDAHCVVPSDKYVNGQRDNFIFSRVNTSSTHNTYNNGSKKGPNLNSGYSAGYSGTVFEPIDEFKGDIARMILYFAVRYENLVSGWNYGMLNNTSNQVFTNQSINVLLTWHNLDPVSQREIDRNNAVYARQNNRNPFIDHPEYVCQIWTAQCASLSSENFITLENISIYPNPSNDGTINIKTDASLEEINVISVNGQLIQQIKNPISIDTNYSVFNLPKGFYFLQLSSNNQLVTKKIVIN
jgi:endonuclease I